MKTAKQRLSAKKVKPERIFINDYGKYRLGLADLEIKEYLKKRAGTTRLGNLYRKFIRVAGVNTQGVEFCECCGKEIVLMYRWDVERFADKMFLGIPTYFD